MPGLRRNSMAPVVAENLMFDTVIGAGSLAVLPFCAQKRPKACSRLPAIYRHFRERLPFGAMQLGRGYRNEISPRQGMIRLREFNMAELEYFIDPETEALHDEPVGLHGGPVGPGRGDAFAASIQLHSPRASSSTRPWHGSWRAPMTRCWRHAGCRADSGNTRDEMAHYALDCWDVELHGSTGGLSALVSPIAAAMTSKPMRRPRVNACGLGGIITRAEVEINGWTIDGAKAGPAFEPRGSSQIQGGSTWAGGSFH